MWCAGVRLPSSSSLWPSPSQPDSTLQLYPAVASLEAFVLPALCLQCSSFRSPRVSCLYLIQHYVQTSPPQRGLSSPLYLKKYHKHSLSLYSALYTQNHIIKELVYWVFHLRIEVPWVLILFIFWSLHLPSLVFSKCSLSKWMDEWMNKWQAHSSHYSILRTVVDFGPGQLPIDTKLVQLVPWAQKITS